MELRLFFVNYWGLRTSVGDDRGIFEISLEPFISNKISRNQHPNISFRSRVMELANVV